MAEQENDKKVTFELKDLTYDELLSTYAEVTEFLVFLEDSKVTIKANVTKENTKEGEVDTEDIENIEEDLEEMEETAAPDITSQEETNG